ncbi:hypothetical protein BDW59DRAFT_148302 [Aspergillus cavernicola]|uniref:Uncharacterized protein n=1 Tax=Aspergillus cavernicola TaxID=176166 RepID=A0ABR4I7N2_9EURO
MKTIISILITLLATTAAATPQNTDPIRCESVADCPAELPVCCGFSPEWQYCLEEGTVC